MKILITGFSGFVSYHFLSYLNTIEPGSNVLGVDKNTPDFDYSKFTEINIEFTIIDLTNTLKFNQALDNFMPEYILHLASISSVAKSWLSPDECFLNNTSILLNLIEHSRKINNKCRILSIGSSEEFGIVKEEDLPLSENHPLHPQNPYAVAKVSQELLSKIYAQGFSLEILMTRSFNHIGPRQKETFAVASFAKQLVQLKKNKTNNNRLITGDLTVIRDFVDVRDVVKAYYLLLRKGRKGECYNICSGEGFMLKNIIQLMEKIHDINVTTIVNEKLIRPVENKKIIGSYKKIKTELNWEPTIPIKKSLEDILSYWEDFIE